MRKPILCLDFDGVLHSYTSGWQGAEIVSDPPVPGAIAFLYEAINRFEVHIFSSRSHQTLGIDAMMEWLSEHERAWRQEQLQSGLSVAKTSLLLHIQWPREKPPAMITIDDRAITFTGEWPSMGVLLAFRPWNKKEPTS